MTNTTEDEITEEDLDEAYRVGISIGLEQASAYLLDKAISYRYYQVGSMKWEREATDNIARLLRKLAASLHERATQSHPNTNKGDRDARS